MPHGTTDAKSSSRCWSYSHKKIYETSPCTASGTIRVSVSTAVQPTNGDTGTTPGPRIITRMDMLFRLCLVIVCLVGDKENRPSTDAYSKYIDESFPKWQSFDNNDNGVFFLPRYFSIGLVSLNEVGRNLNAPSTKDGSFLILRCCKASIASARRS